MSLLDLSFFLRLCLCFCLCHCLCLQGNYNFTSIQWSLPVSPIKLTIAAPVSLFLIIVLIILTGGHCSNICSNICYSNLFFTLQYQSCCTRGNNFSSLQTLAIIHQFLKLRKYEYCAKAAKVMTELFLEDSEFLFLAISVISYQTRLLRVSQNRLQSLIYCDINISPACSVRGEL